MRRTTTDCTRPADNDGLTFTASNNQSTGYVTGSNKTATGNAYLTISNPTLTNAGILEATATVSNGSSTISIALNDGLSAGVSNININHTSDSMVQGYLKYVSATSYSVEQLTGATVKIISFYQGDGSSAEYTNEITSDIITTFTNGFAVKLKSNGRIVVTTANNCRATIPDFGTVTIPTAGVYFSELWISQDIVLICWLQMVLCNTLKQLQR